MMFHNSINSGIISLANPHCDLAKGSIAPPPTKGSK
jgi:hypothetical protein